jgi:hypothetical protein
MLNDMVCVSHCYEHIYIFYNYKHEYPVVDIWTVFYYLVCFDTYSSIFLLLLQISVDYVCCQD